MTFLSLLNLGPLSFFPSLFSAFHVLSLLVLVSLWFLCTRSCVSLETFLFFCSWLFSVNTLEPQILGHPPQIIGSPRLGGKEKTSKVSVPSPLFFGSLWICPSVSLFSLPLFPSFTIASSFPQFCPPSWRFIPSVPQDDKWSQSRKESLSLRTAHLLPQLRGKIPFRLWSFDRDQVEWP